MKTSELNGTLLDFYVAKAEGYEPWAGQTIPKGEFMWKAPRGVAPAVGWMSHKFSQDWSLAGPIIHRERITIEALRLEPVPRSDSWSAVLAFSTFPPMLGPTPLVAAMLAYVASKFGEEVLAGTEIQNG